MRTIKVLKNIIIILLTSFALLTAFEIILRVIFPENIDFSNRSKSNLLGYEFNKDYLVSLKPNIEKKFVRREENGADVILWRTNKDSFRGNDLKKNPEIRIIVYGDSNIQARFSILENTFVYKLERYLEESGGKEVEVINAGVIGFGPDQCLIRFKKEADIYHPDLVIFHISDNDFGDIIKNRLFELDPDCKLIETRHRKEIDIVLKKRSVFIDAVLSLRILKAARKIKEFAIKEKKAEERAEDRAERLIQRCMSAIKQEYSVYEQSSPRYFSHFGDYYDLDIALFPEAKSSKTKIELMGGILKKAKRLADSKGIFFLVLIQPSVVDLTENYVFSYKHLKKYPSYRKTNLTQAVKNICILNNIDFVNLFDVFSKNNPETLFFKGINNHWNDLGQDIAAKETTAYLIRYGKIAP